MEKVGNLSEDIVVACQIHELGEPSLDDLVQNMSGLLRKESITQHLGTLRDWGVIRTWWDDERKYCVSSEAKQMIEETYELWGKQVLHDPKYKG